MLTVLLMLQTLGLLTKYLLTLIIRGEDYQQVSNSVKPAAHTVLLKHAQPQPEPHQEGKGLLLLINIVFDSL